MPFYDYACKCGQTGEFKTGIDEYQKCHKCGKVMERLLHNQFAISFGAAGVRGYYDETLGTFIKSNAHHREVMREQGVTPKGDTPKSEGTRWV